MQKSVWNLPGPSHREETKTFTDPASGWEVTLTLRDTTDDVLMQADVQDYAEELIEYWTGRDEQGNRRVFQAPGLEKGLELGRSMVSMLAGIERLQPGPERVVFEELLGIAVKLPDLWTELLAWAVGFLPTEKPAPAQGNGSGAVGAPSSAPPSSPASDTPTSTPTKPPASGRRRSANGESAGT